MKEPSLSIILPCFNEGETLTELLDSYRLALSDSVNTEVVVVDNGSTDNTWKILVGECEKANPFNLVTVKASGTNIGYGGGILLGLSKSTGEYVSWSHADLQCPGEDIGKLYKKVIKSPNPKKVFGKGNRTNRVGREAILTRIQSVLSWLILGYFLKEINAQPKLFHRSFLNTFKQPPNGYELDLYAFYKAKVSGLDIVTVDVLFLDRKSGESKWAYSFLSRMRFICRMVIYLAKLRILKRFI